MYIYNIFAREVRLEFRNYFYSKPPHFHTPTNIANHARDINLCFNALFNAEPF